LMIGFSSLFIADCIDESNMLSHDAWSPTERPALPTSSVDRANAS